MRPPARPARARRALALAAAVAALAAPLAAQAHRLWLKPSDANFSGDDPWVTVDAAVSNDLFYPDHRPLSLNEVQAIAPDGRKLPLENAASGRFRSTFDVHLTQPGTTRIAVVRSNVGGSYVLDGKTYRVGGFRGGPPGGPGAQGGPGGPGGPGMADRGPGEGPGEGEAGRPRALPGVSDPAQIPAAATEVRLVQATNRTETFVTRGAPTPIEPTGVGLELAEAGTHPTDLVADEPAKFRLLLDGQPAAGVEVDLVLADQKFVAAPPADIKLTTDAQGLFTVKWPAAGYWWLNASAEGARASIPNATRRASYTAILEVQKP